MKRTAIFGPPGTGKTTRLMDIIEGELKDGVPPTEIAFVSFTNAAVNEAKARMSKQFDIKKKDMMWFRTIHSLCHTLAHEPGRRIVKPASLQSFAVQYRVAEFSNNARQRKTGDVALEAYTLSRSAGIDLKDAWMKLTNWVTFDFENIRNVIDAYEDWKETTNRIDFQDMIDHYLEKPTELPLRVSIIDEAQDLNAQQWEVVDKTFCKSERQYVAGDDDQSIYAWAGCRIDKMLEYPADEKIILHKSYRCPKKVHAASHIILNRIKERQEKRWEPTTGAGLFKMFGDVSFLPFDKYKDETWFILARSDFMLDEARWELQRIGAMYIDEKGRSIPRLIANKVMTIHRLKQGESIDVRRFRNAVWTSNMDYNVLDFAHLPSNGKITAEQARVDFTKVDPVTIFSREIGDTDAVDYCIRALAVNGDISQRPLIELNTIHKVKGREADNVAILLDQTSSIIDAGFSEPDNEHRCWYVALTRARKRVFPVMSQSMHGYEL